MRCTHTFVPILVVGLAFAAAAPSPGAGSSPGLSPAGAPEPVSPGGAAELSVTDDPCPTFTWTAASGATGLELVVYDLGAREDETAPGPPRIHRTLPGGAVAWVPPAGSCLEPGGRYAWALRAITGDRAGEWSEPALFAVVTGEGAREEVGAPGGAAVDPGATQAPPALRSSGPPALRRPGHGQGATEGPAPAPDPPPVPGTAPSGSPADSPAGPGTQQEAAPGSATVVPVLFSVAGSVAVAGEYAYTSPRTVIARIPPALFRLRSSAEDDTWSVHGQGYGHVAGADGSPDVALVAPVDVPPGARIVRFGCLYHDGSTTESLDFELVFRRRQAESTVVETLTRVGAQTDEPTASDSILEAATSKISTAVVEAGYDYWIDGRFSTSTPSTLLRLYGCRVTYRVSEAGAV